MKTERLLFAVTSILLCAVSAVAQTYTVTTLASYPLMPQNINIHGRVVGFGQFPGSTDIRGFFWSSNRGVVPLLGLFNDTCTAGFCNQASMLNESGEIIGLAATPWGLSNCVVWLTPPTRHWQPGEYQFFGPAVCDHVNNRDTVTATGVWNPGQPSGAFYFAPRTSCCVTGLPTNLHWAGFNNNDEGLVYVDNLSSGIPDIATWTVTGGLGSVLNIDPGATVTVGAFNDKGQVAGLSSRSSLFFWDPATGLQSIPPLSGTQTCTASVTGMNNTGEVVGNQGCSPFAWTATSGTQDLNQLIPPNVGVVLSGATSINGAGQITAFATRPGGGQNYLGYVLSPKMNVILASAPGPGRMSVVLKATVSSPQGYQPKNGELVKFQEKGEVLGSVQLKQGVANLTVWSLSAGTHLIIAVYGGDENYAPSTSAVLTVVVP